MSIKAMNNNQWKRALQSLSVLFQKADTALHTLGCVAMSHCHETHDARRMLELYNVTGQSTRRQGFLVWVQMFSPIRISDTMKNGTSVKLAKAGEPGYTDYDLADAEARPFWTLEEAKEKTAKPLSVEAFFGIINGFKGQLARAKKGEGKRKIEGNVIQLEALVEDTIASVSRKKASLETPNAPVVSDSVPKPVRKPGTARQLKPIITQAA